MTLEIDYAPSIAEVERALAPDVAYIRWSRGEDHTGADAVFFRVVMSDEAVKLRFLETVLRLRALFARFDVFVSVNFKLGGEPGLSGTTLARFDEQFYFNYRSESECLMLKEPEWQRLP